MTDQFIPGAVRNYTHGPFAPYVRECRLAGSTPVGMLEASQPAGDFSDPATDDLVLIQAVGPAFGQTSNVGGGRFRASTRVNDLFAVPPNFATDIVVDDPHVIRVFALPSSRLAKMMDEVRPCGGYDFGRLHAGPWRSAHVAKLLDLMWSGSGAVGRPGSAFADGLTLSLLASLTALADGENAVAARNLDPIRGGLPLYRLRRVEDLVRARLADDLSLEALATAAGLSPFHFARVFRAETGLSPHAWLLGKRIERAKELLIGTAMNGDEIARAVGFASKQGLIGAFKRSVGTTPQAWRNTRMS